MSKKKKGYAPRCCNKPMEQIWVNTGRTGKHGGLQTQFHRCECNLCGNKILGRIEHTK